MNEFEKIRQMMSDFKDKFDLYEKLLLEWNEKFTKRMQHRYGNDFCKKCRIFPLCHGGCSQHKLETLNIKNQCIRGYDKLYIQKIIEDRVEYLLEKLT